MTERISAVVVTRNRAALLIKCLNALLSQIHPIMEIVIVDNFSSDNTQQVIESFQKKETDTNITCLRMDENVGGAGGFCVGMKKAMEHSPDWIMLLDDDAAPQPEYVSELMREYKIHPSYGCLIGIEFVGTTNQRAYGGRRRISDWSTLKEETVTEEEYKNTSFEIDTAVFVGFMIKRELVNEVGYPDSSLFIYYDDTDYSIRIHRFTRILCVTSARINHRTNFEKDVKQEGQKEWRKIYLFRNQLVIMKRYIQGKRNKRHAMLFSLIREIVSVLRLKKVDNVKIKKISRIVHLIHAYMDVCREKLGKITYVRMD